MAFYTKKGFWDSSNDRLDREIQLEKDEDESDSTDGTATKQVTFKQLYEKQRTIALGLQNEISILKQQLKALAPAPVATQPVHVVLHKKPSKPHSSPLDDGVDNSDSESDEEDHLSNLKAVSAKQPISKPVKNRQNPDKVDFVL